jgi:glycosyltransferase involved in cell wall biosynthesis
LTLVIHAPNIHLGGGRTLLMELLSSLKQPAVVQLDERFELSVEPSSNVQVIKVAHSLIARLNAELRLKLLCRDEDTLLCFGNLPPLFHSKAQVFVYLQNRYLTSPTSLANLPWTARFRIRIERLWLRYFLRNATLLVQTETMAHEAYDLFGCETHILPFLPQGGQPLLKQSNECYDYIYVASGEPHKNHHRLLEAWVILAKKGFRPSLYLTLDTQSDATLCDKVDRLVSKYDLRIIYNPVPHEQMFGLYQQCGALIYPSLFESFGLPLLEACKAGISIIAAERDYVRDVVTPATSFDPESSLSIARAVIRHQNGHVELTMPGDGSSFLGRLAELG